MQPNMPRKPLARGRMAPMTAMLFACVARSSAAFSSFISCGVLSRKRFSAAASLFLSSTTRASTAVTRPSGEISSGLISTSLISQRSAPNLDKPSNVFISCSFWAGASPRNPPKSLRARISLSMESACILSKGAIRKTTSWSASVKTPPRPNITTGPNCSS